MSTTENAQQNGIEEMQPAGNNESEPTKTNDGGGNRLAQFRALFDNPNDILGIGEQQQIQAYILPRTDAHNV